MKQTVFLIALLFATGLKAQGKYEAGMAKGLGEMKAAKTAEDFLKNSAFFERIANAEKTQWLPWYYAALSNIQTGWMDEKSDKDKLAEKSIELIVKAEQLGGDKSELYCLRNMVASQQMMVDPMTRWQTYGAEASKNLENAKKENPDNPRAYFLEAQSKFNTPEAFGGGKKAAKPFFEKAVELYKKEKPASELHPVWGADEATRLLEECSK